MEDMHRKLLAMSQVLFSQKLLVTEEMIAHMEQLSLLSQSMVEEILAEKTTAGKARDLVTKIKTRGPEAYAKFIYCLRTADGGNQEHIAEELFKSEAKLRGVPVKSIEEKYEGKSWESVMDMGETIS